MLMILTSSCSSIPGTEAYERLERKKMVKAHFDKIKAQKAAGTYVSPTPGYVPYIPSSSTTSEDIESASRYFDRQEELDIQRKSLKLEKKKLELLEDIHRDGHRGRHAPYDYYDNY